MSAQDLTYQERDTIESTFWGNIRRENQRKAKEELRKTKMLIATEGTASKTHGTMDSVLAAQIPRLNQRPLSPLSQAIRTPSKIPLASKSTVPPTNSSKSFFANLLASSATPAFGDSAPLPRPIIQRSPAPSTWNSAYQKPKISWGPRAIKHEKIPTQREIEHPKYVDRSTQTDNEPAQRIDVLVLELFKAYYPVLYATLPRDASGGATSLQAASSKAVFGSPMNPTKAQSSDPSIPSTDPLFRTPQTAREDCNIGEYGSPVRPAFRGRGSRGRRGGRRGGVRGGTRGNMQGGGAEQKGRRWSPYGSHYDRSR